MAAGDIKPAFFHGHATLRGQRNRLYRVYVRPNELVLIFAGSGGEVSAALARLAGTNANPLSPEMTQRLEKLNQTPLEELLTDHPYNFRAAPADLGEPTLDPWSFWHALLTWPGQRHVGLFRFWHRRQGRWTLEIPSVEDMRTAMETLPGVLGTRLRINVRWDEAGKRFVAREGLPSGSNG